LSIEFLVIIGIIFICILLIVVFLVPSEKKKKRNKKKNENVPEEQQKDLEQKISRLAKHNQSLRNEILDFIKKSKDAERQLMIERVKVKKIQEKISQERGWRTKEQGDIDKRKKDLHQLKSELVNVQESFTTEHAANIRLTRKVKELESENNNLNDQRREVEKDNAQFKAKNENHRQEIANLKKENKRLSKKEEDVQWIAKAEYERVAKLLKEKEKEIVRISRQTKN